MFAPALIERAAALLTLCRERGLSSPRPNPAPAAWSPAF